MRDIEKMGRHSLRANVAVLTGASSGIGRELAIQLAQEGAWLTLAARDLAKLEEVAQRCRQHGGRVLTVPTDVTQESQCRDLVTRTVEEFGRIDTLINNAGIGLHARFDEIRDLSLLERVIQVNFYGSMYCTHYALPHLKRTRGRLVAVSSLCGRFPTPTAAIYGASKHALAGFFDSLRIELADSDVSVTVIYPGWVATGITSRALTAQGNPRGTVSAHEDNAMPATVCARLITQAVARRRREVVMTIRGKMGLWFRLIAPTYIDGVSLRTMR